MIMNNNVSALNANRQINRVGNAQQRNNERLSTGRQINRASDNAAGLAISEVLLNQINGLDQALRNTQDGVSLLRTADGAVGSMGDILGRARELTVQAGNDTLTNSQRNAIYSEISQILDEVNSISRNTQFNTRNILQEDGGIGLQIGANAGQRLNAVVGAINLDTMGLTNFADLFGNAAGENVPVGGNILSSLISELDAATQVVNDVRAGIGAAENRLEHTASNLSNTSNNLSAANSRIRDTDMARAAIEMHQQNVLQEASMAMLAHANINQRAHLRLLG